MNLETIGLYALSGLIFIIYLAFIARIIMFTKNNVDPLKAITKPTWYEEAEEREKERQRIMDAG